MDQTNQTNPVNPTNQPQKTGIGGTVGAIIIIILIVLGGLYFWGKRLEETRSVIQPVGQTADTTASSSENVNNTNQINLGAELQSTTTAQ